MNSNIMGSLAELANLKQLDKEKLTSIIKECLYQAISKKMILDNELEITTDYNTNTIIARFNRIATIAIIFQRIFFGPTVNIGHDKAMLFVAGTTTNMTANMKKPNVSIPPSPDT